MRTKKVLLAATGSIVSTASFACTEGVTVVVDAGLPPAADGSTVLDAGILGVPDVGANEPDSGEDAGEDAGLIVVDAGIVINDAGPLGVDAGVIIVDAGLILDGGEVDGDVHD